MPRMASAAISVACSAVSVHVKTRLEAGKGRKVSGRADSVSKPDSVLPECPAGQADLAVVRMAVSAADSAVRPQAVECTRKRS